MTTRRSTHVATLLPRAAILLAGASTAMAQVQWRQPEGRIRLTGRTGAAMAYDAARTRAVLFGGLDGSGRHDETWEWDGSSWLERDVATRPPVRSHHAMAWDATRMRTVMFGGQTIDASGAVVFLGDLWEYDGTSWSQRSFGAGPSLRSGAAMAFDLGRSRAVLFGGYSNINVVAADPHWEWDGAQWTQGPAGPTPRAHSAMAFDAARNRTVLFGGIGQCVAFTCPTGADTWEFDGTSWQSRPIFGPASRHSAAMAFDAQRNRIVLMGGQGGCQPACITTYDDAWDYDGAQWTQRASMPARIHSAAMAFDLANARCVAYGGVAAIPFSSSSNNDATLTFDGTQWTIPSPGVGTPAHMSDAIAFDEARSQMVWFGRTNALNPGTPGTFVFTGAAWQRMALAQEPQSRTNHAMAYDRARSRVVLFGGTASNGTFLRDTWEWDGAGWNAITPTNSPPSQYGHALTFDSVRNVTVLYPGAFAQDLLHEYDGVTWTPRTPAIKPPNRLYPGFAFDESRGVAVLFGGIQQLTKNDCWEWDGTAWTQRTFGSAAMPEPRSYSRLGYDAARSRIVLFGGQRQDFSAISDTWEYDGAAWTQRNAGAVPRRALHGMAFDRAKNRMMIVGGYGGIGSNGNLQDTWELVAACDRFGPGELGSGGLPLGCSAEPRVGASFCVQFQNPSPNAAGLDFLLLTPGSCSRTPAIVSPPVGCAPSWLYGLPTDVLVAFGGSPSFCFTVPNSPVFLGAAICFQGSSFEQPGCFHATDAVQVVVQ